MRKLIMRMLIVAGISLVPVFQAQADTENKVDQSFKTPFSQSTEQWSIEVTENGDKNRKPVAAHVYDVTLKNIGVPVSKVSIEAYRPLSADPHSAWEKVSGRLIGTMRQGRTVKTVNMHMKKSVPMMEFIVMWERNGRKYKHSFVIVQEYGNS